MPYRRPAGAPVAQTFEPDTSAGPVTVTLPALAGLEDGYIVRVYDAGSNAGTNNITINDADDVEVAVIDEDDGERYLVVVGGAWEVRGYLPGPSPDPSPDPRLLLSRNVRRLGPVVSPQPLTYIEVV